MTDLTLHIGTTKTGTSSIQANFARQADRLAARGLIYPEAGRVGFAHHNLAYALTGNAVFGKRHKPAAGGWDEALAQIGDQRGIISTEALSFLEASAIERLAAILEPFLGGRALRIVLYLRDQDSWMQSRMKQKAKFARIPLDSDHYLALEDDEHETGFSRSKLLIWRSWAEVFGAERLTVVPFRPEVIGPDVTVHFLSLLGLPEDTLPEKVRRNESPTLKALVAAQVLADKCRDGLGAEFTLGKNAAAKLSNFLADRPDFVDRYSLFSLEHAQAAIDAHVADTAELARILGDDRLHTAHPRGREYAHYIPDPMVFADRLSDEETRFLDALAASVRQFNRA